ncbi:hypothetical protein EDC04DRAFT_3145920 [Pisolithus marmoratus]|nr:hypothetical protein EDC04DRAFT_3145920 [Pisolithus marmoratus]
MAEVPHELRPLRHREHPFVDNNASSPTLVDGLASDKVGHQRASSVTGLRCTCYTLHAILVFIHVTLLVLRMSRLDHHAIIKPEHDVYIPYIHLSLHISNNVAANGLTATLQTIFTLYATALVATTQQLALHHNLLLRQTLTATHDKSAAWNGLGAALLVFWQKPKAAVCGVVLIALYLCGIAGVNITSPLLLSLDTFLDTFHVNKHTQYGMQNLTDFPLEPYWNTATALVRAVGGFTEMPTAGLQDATLYETLADKAAFGNATVNAVTFTAQCHSFPNISTTVADDSSYDITVTYESGRDFSYYSLYPLYENVTYAIDAYGKTVTLLTTPPILDVHGDSGSTFDVPSPFVDSQSMTIQITTCVLSVINQTAVINVQTNALTDINRTPSPTDSTWTPLQSGLTGTYDHRLNWFQDAWGWSSLSTDYYTPMACSDCFLSFLDEYIMSFLGRQYNESAANLTAVSTTPNTLNELEAAVAHVASAAAWAVLTTSGYYNKSSGRTSVTHADLKSRLNINTVPVAIGFSISIILLVLSVWLTREPPSLFPDSEVQVANAVCSGGILEVIWLSSRHSTVQKGIIGVQHPSSPELRKAGLFPVVLGRVGGEDYVERGSGLPEGE